MEGKETKAGEALFSFNFMKKFCVIIYLVFLSILIVAILWHLIDYIRGNNNIDALTVFLILVKLFLTPFLLLLVVYPVYALAYISNKNKQIIDEQQIIERLLSMQVINDNKKEE